MAHKWEKMPSTTSATGGKPYFYARRSPKTGEREWVLWDRKTKSWSYSTEGPLPSGKTWGYAPLATKTGFKTAKAAMKYADSHESRSHAMGAAKKSKKASNTFDIYEIAKKLALPDFNDDVYEANLDYISEAGYQDSQDLRRELENLEEPPDDLEQQVDSAREKAEQAAGDNLFRQWQSAVERAAEEIWGFHHLELIGSRGSVDYTIEPQTGKTWHDVAVEIARTINGVGLVDVPAEEYRRNPRKWVMEHLGSMQVQPEVYGTASAERIYESSFR